MGKKNTTEQIIIKLREIEVLCGQRKTIGEAVRQAMYYLFKNHVGVSPREYKESYQDIRIIDKLCRS